MLFKKLLPLFLIAIISLFFSSHVIAQEVANRSDSTDIAFTFRRTFSAEELAFAGWEQVVAYEVDYNKYQQRYIVKVELPNQTWWQILSSTTPEKFKALQAFLRNESPIYVNTSTGQVHAFYEDIGEGEE